ncbi:MAG: hypothetical protein HGA79_00425 [Anaerolineales bacterium]|nr:hypothetical protein [Anaerolineales bacterium]
MQTKCLNPLFSFFLVLAIVSLACGTAAPEPTSTPEPTDTPAPTATVTATLTPTNTPRPSPTPRPTKTPNLAATERADELNAEAQAYFDLGYLETANGRFKEYDDFREEWAQLNWYQWWILSESTADFYMNAHFEWESAYQNADTSGCGFVFAIQDNNDHYAAFLDRTRVLFLISNGSGTRELGRTRGTGRVKFGNPGEADFTLIVKGHYAYVLVDEVVIGEYTLSQSQPVRGNLGLTILSGTNKDYGTRCEMTNLHAWFPEN